VVAHPLLTEFVSDPPKDKLEFDEIFVINLQRRPERRQRMEWIARQLGLDVHYIDAVDGKSVKIFIWVDLHFSMNKIE
jgi:collagen beta-1,O-galactosyltransferase